MPDGSPPPNEADFTKTLMTVLLAEYLGVVAARALSVTFDGPSAASQAVSLAASCLFFTVLASNLATITAAFGMRRDRAHAGIARISLSMTTGQLAILIASWLCSDAVFLGLAAALTSAALVATLACSPGRFLRPPT